MNYTFLRKNLFLALQWIALSAVLTAAVFTVPYFTSAQSTGDYSLSTDDDTYESGDTVEVTWEADANDDRRDDWIGLYETGDSNRDFIDWEYIDEDDQSGSLTFEIDEPGTYEFRYFKNNGYTREATSDSFTVSEDGTGPDDDDDDDDDDTPGGGGSDDYSISVSDTTLDEGDTATISWTYDESEDNDNDWIGIYEDGARDDNYRYWQYVDNDSDNQITVTFVTPGDYQIRYFKNGGFEQVAQSAIITVGEGTGGDDDDDDGPGGGDDDDDESDEYELSLSDTSIVAGETITVSWQAPDWLNLRRDWIGLYRVGADDEDYIYWGYTSRIGDDGSLTFRVNSPGTYEFRYLKNDSFDVVATSEEFTVTSDGTAGVCPLTSSELAMIENYPPEDGPIIAFGDSLTSGVGADNGWDYVSQLERQAGVDIINAGETGDTTEDALDRLQSDVLSRDPSVVIVWLGGNDIIGRVYERAEAGLDDLSDNERLQMLALRIAGQIPDSEGITQAETFENLETIIERIQATGAVTIVVGFGDGYYEDGLEERYEELAEDTDSIYVPGILDGILGRPSLMDDLVHPDEDGYEIVAGRILPRLQCVI